MGVPIKTTFGRRVYKIAVKRNVSRVVAETLIKDYIDSLIEDSVNGKDVTIDGYISIKVVEDSNGELVLRGRVSDALKKRLADAKTKTNGE